MDKKKQDINDFLETYEKIVDDLIGELSTTYEQPKYAVEWIKRVKKKISSFFFFFFGYKKNPFQQKIYLIWKILLNNKSKKKNLFNVKIIFF